LLLHGQGGEEAVIGHVDGLALVAPMAATSPAPAAETATSARLSARLSAESTALAAATTTESTAATSSASTAEALVTLGGGSSISGSGGRAISRGSSGGGIGRGAGAEASTATSTAESAATTATTAATTLTEVAVLTLADDGATVLGDELIEGDSVLGFLLLLGLGLLLNEVSEERLLLLLLKGLAGLELLVVDDGIADLDLEVILRALLAQLSNVVIVAEILLLGLDGGSNLRIGGGLDGGSDLSAGVSGLLVGSPVELALASLLDLLAAAGAGVAVKLALARLGGLSGSGLLLASSDLLLTSLGGNLGVSLGGLASAGFLVLLALGLVVVVLQEVEGVLGAYAVITHFDGYS